MSSAPAHEHHSRRILDAFESNHGVSQRSLAKELGIALGLANLLVKRLVRKGWVRVIQIKPNRMRYLITPAGIAEKTRMSRAYICLVETDLQLVGVVDAARTKPFFGLSVYTPLHLDGLALNGQPFNQLVVMSFGNTDALRAEVLALRVPLDCVFWV